MSYEVDRPILNNPFDEPAHYWFLREGYDPELREGRRPAIVYPPREGNVLWSWGGVLKPSSAEEFAPGYEMTLVNKLRQRVKEWRSQNYPGVTRTTLDLLTHWNRPDREQRLFFAQREAVETIIFLTEARMDLRQGIQVPVDSPIDTELKPFQRYACKMATGSGKTTVMGMLTAWSILNKVSDRSDTRFSDVVLVVCPNVTIKSRLQELDPNNGEASLYRTRDLIPSHLMDKLRQGKVLVTNWHLFERRSPSTGGSDPAKVVKVGVKTTTTETIKIGKENTTARGVRYLTLEKLEEQTRLGLIKVLEEKKDKQGNLLEVKISATRYLESEAAWIRRILSQEVGNKGRILILNDEAHHAYRVSPSNSQNNDEDDEASEYEVKESTIWVEGLDRIHKHRTINLCVDLSATPYYLRASAKDANKPFPWVVSDFSLMDAIESGLVKIPQLPLRDTTGKITSSVAYFNIWQWIRSRMTPGERGGKKTSPKPEAVLKYAQHPITLLAGQWEETRLEWLQNPDDSRPPVFIIVCKNTKIAKVIYDWIADDNKPPNVPSSALKSLRNTETETNTIRVDCKVVEEIESGNTKSDDSRWMRLTLDTIGLVNWPKDDQQRSLYPEGFENLAIKLEKPLHPPGRDIRCIISVGMLTEGWDCRTVTHIIGIRPFMSQLLCEQVVGRGLRRRDYELNKDDQFSEETAKIFGVPFEVTPFKANPGGKSSPTPPRNRIYSVATKSQYRIEFPRVESYTQGVQNKVTVDWQAIAPLTLDPSKIPPEVQVKASLSNNQGRQSMSGPGKLERLDLNPYRKNNRLQTLIFELAKDLTKAYCQMETCEAPPHVLFPQLQKICHQYLHTKIKVIKPCELADAWLSPYYGWIIENLSTAIYPDTDAGEAPEIPRYETHRDNGSTDDVDFWTAKAVYPIKNSHLNAIVADTHQWEQATAYYIDTHPITEAFVKNERLNFTIPYTYNDQDHEYIPDFIIRLKSSKTRYVIFETKGYRREGTEEKKAATERWCRAVNADGRFGHWEYKLCKELEVIEALNEIQQTLS
jgi:type III restriction enzyme